MDRKEWLVWRHNGIGSSDAAALMNVSPYKTLYDLWREKISENPPEQEFNLTMQIGNDLEPIARNRFAAHYCLEYGVEEDFSAKLVENGFMKASLDGASSDLSRLIEVKYQGENAHVDFRNHIIPPHFIAQIQWAMMVSGASLCYLISINEKHETFWHEIKEDPEYQNHLKERAHEFWNLVKSKIAPELTIKDYKSIPADANDEREYFLAKEMYGCAEARLEAIKEKLIFKAQADGHPKIKMGSLIIDRISKKGGIDFSRIADLKNVDLEKYRKPSISYFKVGEFKND